MIRECFCKISEKIRGAHIEIGSDDSIWLMPDGDINMTAMRWRSADEFLLGNSQTFSIFGWVGFIAANMMNMRDGCRKFVSLNEWMKPLSNCSSLEELQLMMACIG